MQPDGPNRLGRFFPSSLLWSFFLLLLVFFEVQRLGLLLRHWPSFRSGSPLSALLAAFVHGSRLDQVTSAYLMLPPALAALVLSLLGARPRTVARVLAAVMLAEIAPVAVAAWGELEFFGYFRDRYNALALEYLDTPAVVWQTVWERYHPLLVAGEAALTWWLFLCALRWCGRRLAAETSRTAAASGVLVSILLAVVLIRGGWGLVPTRWGSAYFSPYTPANQLALNGLFSLATEVEYGDATRNEYDYYPDAEAFERARAILANPGERYTGSASEPLEKLVEPLPPPLLEVDRPNVVLVLMESLSAQAVGALGGPLAATPELDQLSKDGVLFTRYYSQGLRTGRALFSVLAGMPAPPGTNIMKSSAGRRRFSTLAAVLHEQGYLCRFVYGGDLSFENMDGFLRHNDFDELVGLEDFPGGRLWQWRMKWGVPDNLVFDRAHELLSRPGPPNLTVILTLTNHPPFRLPPESSRPYSGPLADERNAVGYADWALGRFIEKARGAPYFKRTLFVIMGDHGQFYEGLPSSDVTYFHVPCLFYGPGVLALPPGRVDGLAGHVDIAPTVVGLLGRPARHAFWGRDLFHQPEAPPRVLMAFYRSMLLVEPGRVLRDELQAGPVLFAHRDDDVLEKLEDIPPGSSHPMLVKERTLTQVLKRLTGPRGPALP